MGLGVEVAELPDDGVDVALLVIGLRLLEEFFPFHVVEFTSLLELSHDLEKETQLDSQAMGSYLEEPVGHAFGELGHELVGALVELFAFS